MSTLNLGKIRFNWTGAYNNSTAYVANDVVSSGGNSYICILASTGNAVSNATYWSIMSSAGTNGTNGTDLGTVLTTQGDVAYRDGSGLQKLGAGTSGQFLKTQGTGANPVWGDAGGGVALLDSQDINNTQNNVDVGGFNDTLYHSYRLDMAFRSSTGTGYLYMQMSDDNGSSFFSGSSCFCWTSRMWYGGSVWDAYSHGSTTATLTHNNTSYTPGSNQYREGYINIFFVEPQSTTGMTAYYAHYVYNHNDGQLHGQISGHLKDPEGNGNEAKVVNKIRIAFSHGANFQPGRTRLYGFVKS